MVIKSVKGACTARAVSSLNREGCSAEMRETHSDAEPCTTCTNTNPTLHTTNVAVKGHEILTNKPMIKCAGCAWFCRSEPHGGAPARVSRPRDGRQPPPPCAPFTGTGWTDGRVDVMAGAR